jgi:RNA polymerase sigma-70 factor (ECF subfamily)
MPCDVNRAVSIRDKNGVTVQGSTTGQGVRMGSSDLSDADLLSLVAAHDAPALRVFHDRHAPWVLARMRHRCSNDDMVFDALQDTFVAVWRTAGSWRGEGEPAAWLWGIASRRLIGAQRDRMRWAPVSIDEPVDATELGDSLGQFVDRSVLDEALGTLPTDLRDVVMATYVDGLTTVETGRLLDIPDGTVKTRLMRARRRLRGVLS